MINTMELHPSVSMLPPQQNWNFIEEAVLRKIGMGWRWLLRITNSVCCTSQSRAWTETTGNSDSGPHKQIKNVDRNSKWPSLTTLHIFFSNTKTDLTNKHVCRLDGSGFNYFQVYV